MREKKRQEHLLATDADLGRRGDDIAAYFELAKEGENVDADLRRDVDSLRVLVDKLETETLLSGPNDALNAIVTIHPGAGRAAGIRDRSLRLPARRRGGVEVGDLCGERRVCLWPFEQRDRRAPPGAHFAVRPSQAAAYFVRQRFCLSGN